MSFTVSVVVILLCSLLTISSGAEVPTADELQKISDAAPAAAPVTPEKPRKLLIFNRCEGFVHSSIPYIANAVEIMGKKTGAYESVMSDEMIAFEADNLAQFDAILFNNTTTLAFENEEYRKNLMEFVKSGKGIIGIHGATDNFYNWQEAAEMMGGVFDGHPWGGGGTWDVKNEDPNHPINQAFGGKDFEVNDELYRVKPFNLRENSRILLGVDTTSERNLKAEGIRTTDIEAPISWVRSFGNGRVFYCSLGHNHHLTWTPAVLAHYLAGIQFAMGDLVVDVTPLPKTQPDMGAGLSNSVLDKIKTYKYGDEIAVLQAVNEYITLNTNSQDVLSGIEQEMTEFLKSDATYDSKKFVCEKLSVIGSDYCVPTLVEMLLDKTHSDIARYALERIDSEAVNPALMNALTETDGDIKAGIINTLGMRGESEAAGELGKLITSENQVTASAAVSALGRIGTVQACDALLLAIDKVDADLQNGVTDSILQCAERAVENGDMVKAGEIYESLYAEKFSPVVRAAALKGIIEVKQEDALETAAEAISSNDDSVSLAAIQFSPLVPGEKAGKVFSFALLRLDEDKQMPMIAALEKRGDPIAIAAIATVLKSDSKPVRLRAIEALGNLPSEKNVPILVEFAAKGDKEESAAARNALYNMRGSEIDTAIVKYLNNSDYSEKAELIKACAERNIVDAKGQLMQLARDQKLHKTVRLACYEAISVIGTAEDFPAMLEILSGIKDNSERNAAGETVTRLGGLLGEGEAVKQIIENFGHLSDPDKKALLLGILSRFGDNAALELIYKSANSKETVLNEAAVRALSDWPNAEPKAFLEEYTLKAENKKLKILALRGYIKMLGLQENVDAADFEKAMNIAEENAEKKMVLSSLGSVKNLAAFDLVARYSDDEVLKAEAQAALVAIGESIYAENRDRVMDVLEAILQNPANDSIAEKARAVIAKIEEYSGFITTWQVAGPYQKENTDASKLMDMVFAPEEPGAEVDWKNISSNDATPWLIPLDEKLGGTNCVAYLRVNIISKTDQDVIAELGSDDGIKGWLGGQVICENNVSRACQPRQEVVPVKLKQGSNLLMLKISQGTGYWSACAKIVKSDGSRLDGVEIQSDF